VSTQRVRISVGAYGRIVYPWDRQKGESKQAYEAFRLYLDSALRGRPSIRKTAERLDKSRQLLEGWSKKWSWVKRVDQCIVAEDRVKLARTCAEVEEQARLLALRNQDLIEIIPDGDLLLRLALTRECAPHALVGLVGIDRPLPSLRLGERPPTKYSLEEHSDPRLGAGLGESSPHPPQEEGLGKGLQDDYSEPNVSRPPVGQGVGQKSKRLQRAFS
jgi:hypothetical protein